MPSYLDGHCALVYSVKEVSGVIGQYENILKGSIEKCVGLRAILTCSYSYLFNVEDQSQFFFLS